MQYEEPVFRPPSEAQSLIVQITIGCSHNRCAFCAMYKTKNFRLRREEDIITELARLPESYLHNVRRLFLADGDALIYPQDRLLVLLDKFAKLLPNLSRIGIYASPNSLATKSKVDLVALKEKKLAILYYGLESGDPKTLIAVGKGYAPEQMLEQCQKVQQTGLKLSVTAILGLAGLDRSYEHAVATAKWVNALSPRYFSLLTLFQNHSDPFYDIIKQLTNGQVIEEALLLVRHLHPDKTILRSNHVSNVLSLAGRYPADREKIIHQAETALAEARNLPHWFDEISEHGEM